ncbi:helix-turn-helix domain-containing protein [Enterococcus hulanensis]|uniref:helix-turn-helix domain-containing protein n=1 Tax=Enterococcus hulanensis TaxID=2559929 RepID=UPI00288CD551|nr:helix-turn-helix domain-containing protein [Enterococcus hulanensis]MDT2661119.1 helix-turn-helix domain-containing protein [Enterococcus hulanensis]
MEKDVDLTYLVVQAKEGNEEAMEELLRRFHKLLRKYSINYFGYLDEDCYQALSEQFIKAVKQFDPNWKEKIK